ncbi:MAG: hypothetical protein H7Y17_08535 [Chlorobia bacterium]|nr:hypothetical protein [Fimbriimonadaceae bacterium]
MKLSLIGVTLVLVSAALSQNPEDTHGKTHTQILAMGFDKWYDFYTGKEGETTQGMAQAGYKYASSLKWRNDALIKNLRPADQKPVLRLRTHLDEFGTSTIQVFRALNGGGTIWQLTFSSNAMEVEETIYGLLVGTKTAPKPMVVSAVSKEIALLERSFKSAPASSWDYGISKTDTAKQLARAKLTFQEIVKIAKAYDRRKSDRILGYCRDVLVNSKMDG